MFKYDFAYDQYVDETLNGASTGGMRLRIVTVASDLYGVGDQRLIMDSQVNNEAIVVLSADTPYFDELEQAMKIRKYVKQRKSLACVSTLWTGCVKNEKSVTTKQDLDAP